MSAVEVEHTQLDVVLDLDPELGQMAAELERALDTAAARRGEVERDQEQAHGEPV